MRRIPIQNIYYILCYAWGIGGMRGRVNVGIEKCPSLSDLLVHVLLNATDDVLKRGMAQGYFVFGDEIDGIKGKVNIGETLKQGRHLQGRMFCQYDELTSDILINQIIYSTLLNSAKIAGLSDENRDRIAKTLRRMPQTKRIRITEHMLRTCIVTAFSMSSVTARMRLPNGSITILPWVSIASMSMTRATAPGSTVFANDTATRFA